MLQSIRIQNFKSYRDATLPLAPLTLMIGANASGKSNFIEGVRLASRSLNLATRELFREILSSGSWFRGTPADIPFNRDLPTIVALQIDEARASLPIFVSEEHFDIPSHMPPIHTKTLRDLLYLHAVPSKMRGDSFLQEKWLAGDGANLSGVVAHLIAAGQLKYILQFARSLPEQDIQDIQIQPTRDGDWGMLKIIESFGERTRSWPASLLSDGTLRVLAVAAVLLSAPRGGLVIIEEIDNGVHPSRVRTLLETIQETARHLDLRVLLTSHNPALADALPLSAIPDVVFCYRDPQEGDSRLVRLEDILDYPELVARGSLGRLMTEGLIDRYAKDPRTREDRIRQGAAWMDGFFGEEAS